MAAPLILARTFAQAHRFAQEELGLSVGYYRVVNSAGTIKACRNVDIFLVEGWDKRPDRFTMKSALKWCRLNIRDVEEERKSAAAFDAAMPPAPVDTSVHWVKDFAFVHAIDNVEGIQSSTDKADVDCDICLAAIADLEEPAAEMPEPAEAEEATTEDAPIDEAEPEIEIVSGPSAAPAAVEPDPEPEQPAEPAKRRRRTRCKDCGTLHFKEEACPPSEDA